MADDHRMVTGSEPMEKEAQANALGRTVSTIHHTFNQEGEVLFIEFVDGYALAVTARCDGCALTSRWLSPSELDQEVGW